MNFKCLVFSVASGHVVELYPQNRILFAVGLKISNVLHRNASARGIFLATQVVHSSFEIDNFRIVLATKVRTSTFNLLFKCHRLTKHAISRNKEFNVLQI